MKHIKHALNVKRYARSEMKSYNGCKHAVYGYAYYDPEGRFIEEIANTPDDILYFYSEEAYDLYVNSVYRKYNLCEDVRVYAVHNRA